MTGDQAHGHEHDDGQGAGPGWWKVMDIFVWVAVVLIVILGTEWLVGLLIREKLAAGFDKLRRTAAPVEPE